MRRIEGGGSASRLPLAQTTSRAATSAQATSERLSAELERLRNRPLVAVVLIVLMVGVLVGVLGDSDPAPSEAPAPQLPALTESLTDKKVGIAARYPAGWRAERRSGTVRLRPDDGTALISVASPARASESPRLLRAAVGEVDSGYRRVQPLGRERIGISGRSGSARTFSAVNDSGTPLRVLVATLRGDRRAYLLSTFAAQDEGARLAEIERILSSLRLRK